MALPEFTASTRYLSIKEAMELLNLRSRTSLWRYCRNKGLTSYKLGNHRQAARRFRYDEIVWWIEAYKKQEAIHE